MGSSASAYRDYLEDLEYEKRRNQLMDAGRNFASLDPIEIALTLEKVMTFIAFIEKDATGSKRFWSSVNDFKQHMTKTLGLNN